MATYNKTGVAKYYVTTDTHCSPWGHRNGVNGKTIHFDLGDNTAASHFGDRDYPETMSVAAKIALLGNHDTSVKGVNPGGESQIYKDNQNKVIFFGLDTGTTNIETFAIPQSQLDAMAREMSLLENNWDVIVLTHVPLFPGKNAEENAQWNCGAAWSSTPEDVNEYAAEAFKLLHAFAGRSTYTASTGVTYSYADKNGYVIGCFAGHIHTHVKCTYEGFPMEAFTTNGYDEWTDDQAYNNVGLYEPDLPYINVNFNAKTVNGMSYTNPEAGYVFPYNTYHDEAHCYYIDKAAGYFKLQLNTLAHPKFYNGTYIGYSGSPLDGTSFNHNGNWDRYWPLGGTVNLTINDRDRLAVTGLWFDMRGRLRYYTTDSNVTVNSEYKEISGYDRNKITFTACSVLWTFQDGLLISVTPTYRSGTLKAKYEWGIAFDEDGMAEGITYKNEGAQDFGAGQNYVNVTNIKIYDGTTLKEITNMPQIGITGSFKDASGSLKDDIKIDLARADYSGANQISSPDNLLIRVVGDDGAVMWLYNGKLTSLTDQQVL